MGHLIIATVLAVTTCFLIFTALRADEDNEVSRYSLTDVRILHGPHRTFEFTKPGALSVSQDEDGDFVVTHQQLSAQGCGESCEEALAEFAEMFEVQWESLVETSDLTHLAPDARRARERLLSFARPRQRTHSV